MKSCPMSRVKACVEPRGKKASNKGPVILSIGGMSQLVVIEVLSVSAANVSVIARGAGGGLASA